MPYSYRLTSIIPATPRQIYDAWLDSIAHSEMTGGEANMSDEVGGAFSAWEDYITGRNLELVPGERIVQSWRTIRFTDEHEDSTVTITFEENDDGTLLTLVHSNVPDDQRHYEEGGWESKYFAPMKAYFAGFGQDVTEAPATPTAAEARTVTRPRRAAGKTLKKAVAPAKTASKQTKRAAAKKTKRAAAKKTKRAVAKKTKRAAAKKTKRAVAKKTRRAAAKKTKRAVAKKTKRAVAKKTKRAAAKKTKRAVAKKTKRAAAKKTRHVRPAAKRPAKRAAPQSGRRKRSRR